MGQGTKGTWDDLQLTGNELDWLSLDRVQELCT